jgi:hypothetical protein
VTKSKSMLKATTLGGSEPLCSFCLPRVFCGLKFGSLGPEVWGFDRSVENSPATVRGRYIR